MKAAHVLLLAGLAALAILVAFALGSHRSGPPAGDLLLPGLAGSVNEVTGVAVAPGDGEPFRVVRGATAWTVPGRHDYPADAGIVRRLVLALAEARIVETKTSRPELHSRLGLAETGDGSGTVVTLEGIGESATVVVGEREAPGGRGTYVRRQGEDTALLVDQAITVETDQDQWLDQEVMDVPAGAVDSIEITHPDGDQVTIRRGEDGRLALARIPEGREVSGPTAADALGRALAALRFDDVRPSGEDDAGAGPVVAVFTLSDGTLVEATSRRLGEETWTRFSVTPAAPPEAAEPNDGPGSAVRLAVRLRGWTYRLPAWKAEQLTRRLDDLLRPLPQDD